MKKLLFSLTFLLTGLISLAQSPLDTGNFQANAGFGINSEEQTPIVVGADYGLVENVTLGAKVAFSKKVSIGGNVNYHFDELLNLPSDWNVYGGGSLTLLSGYNDNFDIGLQAGARKFFNENLGINLEFGGGSKLTGGLLGATYVF